MRLPQCVVRYQRIHLALVADRPINVSSQKCTMQCKKRMCQRAFKTIFFFVFLQDSVNGKGWSARKGGSGTKKTFASRLSSQLDKLKPRGRDKGALGATDRSPSAGWTPNTPNPDLAFRERYGQFVVAGPSPVMAKASPFSVRHASGSKYSPIMRPKRTFRNVMPMRAAAAGSGSGRNHGGGSAASRSELPQHLSCD